MAVVRLAKLEYLKRLTLFRDFPWLISGLGLVMLVSFIISVLTLAQPLYMMSLYDRVLSSLSRDTLLALTLITTFLLGMLGFLETYRQKLLGRMADALDEVVRPRLFPVLIRLNLEKKVGGQAFASLEQVKGFFNSQHPAHLMDLPFAPIYLAVLFALHPWMGYLSLAAAVGMAFTGYRLETYYKVSSKTAQAASKKAMSTADSALRSAEVVASMGMLSAFQAHWLSQHKIAADGERAAADEMATVTGFLKAGMLLTQTLVLGLACYLVLEEQATVGALFASNVLVSRLVAPMQSAMMAWGNMTMAWSSWGDLKELLAVKLPTGDRTRLPPPSERLEAVQVWARVGGGPEVLRGVQLVAKAGEIIGLYGPSGAGKSTFCRVLVGVLGCSKGGVLIDGAPIDSWDFDELGAHVGYVPQTIDILDGTVASNIRRFGEYDDAATIEAATTVGIHQAILRLSDGYDTQIFSAFGALSGGQRQRLAIARAIYRWPKIVVLDEPNANLDLEGLRALKLLLEQLRQRGSIVVLATHDPILLQRCDRIAVMRNGKTVKIVKPSQLFSPEPASSGQPEALPAPDSDDVEEEEAT